MTGRAIARKRADKTARAEKPAAKSEIVSGEYIANICGLTSRRVRQLAAEGHLAKHEHGKYLFPDTVRDYCDWLRRGLRSDGDADLKNRELDLKCRVLEQKLKEKRDALRDEIEQQCWEEIQDCLAEYKSEMSRLNLPDADLERLNATLETAIQNVAARAADGLSEVATEERSD